MAPVIAFGSLFYWHDHVRPPVSLERALEIAKRELGDDHKNRYCVSVQLFGNPYANPKPGAWNLLYAATDGSKKHVYIDMNGNAKVDMWNEAINWEQNAGRRTDLEDISSRLRAFFEKEKLDTHVQRSKGRLRIQFRPRRFQVYTKNDGGSYGDELTEMIGPQPDGIIIDVTLTDIPAVSKFEHAPYWFERIDVYPLKAKEKYVRVQVRQGKRFKREYAQQIGQIFGQPINNG